MLGMHLSIDGKAVVAECMRRVMLTNSTGDNVLRFMPAMTVTKKEIDLAMEIVEEAFAAVARAKKL